MFLKEEEGAVYRKIDEGAAGGGRATQSVRESYQNKSDGCKGNESV